MKVDEKLLKRLLSLDESGWLDFKREMYKVADRKAKDYDWQKNEMVRDILSLVNGNTHAAGKPAYLVIGAADELNRDKSRSLFDVGDFIPARKQVMSWVNAYAEPVVEELYTDHVPYQGKRLLVIEIPPSRHVHRIKRPLQTGYNTTYHENTIFMRAGDSIITAGLEQVDTLRRAKKQAHAVNRYVNPIWLLAAVFAYIFGTIRLPLDNNPSAQMLIQELGETQVWLFVHLFLAVFMSVIGAMLGWGVMQIQDARLMWVRATWKGKFALGFLFVVVMAFVVWVLRHQTLP